MDILVDKLFSLFDERASKHHNRGCTISHLIVCCLANLYHHLGCRMLNVYLFENCSAVICYCYISKSIDKHLVHSSWAKRTSNYFSNQLCSRDVVLLGISAFGLRCTFLEN